ncbi:MAG: hypothetical protein ABR591_04485 [Candidatus Velthaea sp.]
MFSSRRRLALACALILFAAPAAAGPPTPNRPPHGFPKIFAVFLSTKVVRPGQRVTGRVVTSTNVGYVEARIENYNAPMQRDGMGKFSLAYTVPAWLQTMPWFKHGWTLQIVARSIDGVEAKLPIPIVLQ